MYKKLNVKHVTRCPYCWAELPPEKPSLNTAVGARAGYTCEMCRVSFWVQEAVRTVEVEDDV